MLRKDVERIAWDVDDLWRRWSRWKWWKRIWLQWLIFIPMPSCSMPYATSMPSLCPLLNFSALFMTPPLLVCNQGRLHFPLPVDVTHQTRLVQWTWNILLIRDYPGARDECDPRSSHPLHENQPSLWRRIHEDGLSWCEKWVWHVVAIHCARRLSWRERWLPDV